jgi:uncharacterized membrane protein YozB (DUF420 family)
LAIYLNVHLRNKLLCYSRDLLTFLILEKGCLPIKRRDKAIKKHKMIILKQFPIYVVIISSYFKKENQQAPRPKSPNKIFIKTF